VVEGEEGVEKLTLPPETLLQLYELIVPSGSDPLPLKFTLLVGRVIDWSDPAFAVGDWLAAAMTVTETEKDAVAPPLSVTVRRNV
jgi:hypothetical protein